jgi:hypothetical protein
MESQDFVQMGVHLSAARAYLPTLCAALPAQAADGYLPTSRSIFML